MGENTQVRPVQHNPTERIQQEIRHTEADISMTVHQIEDRLSPRNIKRRAVNEARRYMWKSVASAIDFVQRKPAQTAMAGAAVVLLMAVSKKKSRSRKSKATGMEVTGVATRAFLSGVRGKTSKEASHSGTSFLWRGLGTALGAAIGTYIYNRQNRPAVTTSTAPVTDQPRAGAYPGTAPSMAIHAPSETSR